MFGGVERRFLNSHFQLQKERSEERMHANLSLRRVELTNAQRIEKVVERTIGGGEAFGEESRELAIPKKKKKKKEERKSVRTMSGWIIKIHW